MTDRITITLSLTPDQLWTLYRITHDAGGNLYQHDPADAHNLTVIAERVNKAACLAKGLPLESGVCTRREK
jgi:hypothetical protein